MARQTQGMLFPDAVTPTPISDKASSTFVNNMSVPVHRWFRYSAGFSAEWVGQVISQSKMERPTRVFDPFAGSATTLLVAEGEGVPSWGVESHPFVSRIARAKLAWRNDPEAYRAMVGEVRTLAKTLNPSPEGYPPLIYKCYDDETLAGLDRLRQAYEISRNDSPASELVWLTLVGILRKTSHAGTAQWQYVLPRKQKRSPQNAYAAFDDFSRTIYHDMLPGQSLAGPRANLAECDARSCSKVPDGFADLVITSPPYPNNYDYADATRLEMSFMRKY